MLWWELSARNEHPVVDLRVLHNRPLAASIFLFIALGFGLYGGVILFPLFAQGILHFTPTETGLAMLPGGVATGASALVCGKLLNGRRPLVDARILIAFGVLLFAVSLWKMGHLTTVAGEIDVRNALLVRGFEYHRADLVSNVIAGNPLTDQRVQMLTHAFTARGMPAFEAQRAALEALDAQVMQQASMLAFNDSWLFILVVFALVSPAILLLGRGRGAGGASSDAH
jgi:DHA2 family multidrug resistance protein